MIESFFYWWKIRREYGTIVADNGGNNNQTCVCFLMQTWKAIAVGKFSDNEIALPPVDLSETANVGWYRTFDAPKLAWLLFIMWNWNFIYVFIGAINIDPKRNENKSTQDNTTDDFIKI